MSDDPIEALRNRLDTARGDYNKKVLAAHNDPTQAQSFVTGWSADRVVVRGNDGTMTPKDVITNGAIGLGDVVTVRGKTADAKPRVKRQPSIVTRLNYGKIKFSYTVTGSSSAFFGGWQPNHTFKQLAPATVGASFGIKAYVDNLGGDRYAIDCQFSLNAEATSRRTQRLGQNAWSLDLVASYKGRGLWQDELILEQPTATSDPNNLNYVASYSIALASNTVATDTFTYYTSSLWTALVAPLTYGRVTTFHLPLPFRPGVGRFSLSLDNHWAGYLFPGVTHPFTISLFSSPFYDTDDNAIPQSSHASVAGAIVLAAKLDQGVGFVLTYSGTYTNAEGVSSGSVTVALQRINGTTLEAIATPTIAPTLLSLRDNPTNDYAEAVLTFSQYWLEVDDRGNLRAFKKSDFAALVTGDLTVDCLVYDGTTLEYSRTEKLKVFKPNNFTATSIIQNISYHS